MTLNTKTRLLRKLVRASGLHLNETVDQVRIKLNGIKARSRVDCLRKMAVAFGLPDYAVRKIT